MKVLLTGASGFVGSHVLESLRARSIPTVLLLRSSSSRAFLEAHLPAIELRLGSLNEPASLPGALAGVSHVIHCAGCTKAVKAAEFYSVNQQGTRNLVEAINAQPGAITRLLHLSSQAVSGPATPARPAREQDPPQPLSQYGHSKLAGELEVREGCRIPFVVLRPPAVYGPRDTGFFSMFQAVQRHLLPLPSATQALSLVYVKDLAEAVVGCLEHPAVVGQTYFVASPEVVTGRQMAQLIAAQIGHWTLPCPLPAALLWPFCLGQQLLSQLTGKPALLNLQKFAELRAPGWVCSAAKLTQDTGLSCPTSLEQGVAQTLAWYRQNHWL